MKKSLKDNSINVNIDAIVVYILIVEQVTDEF